MACPMGALRCRWCWNASRGRTCRVGRCAWMRVETSLTSPLFQFLFFLGAVNNWWCIFWVFLFFVSWRWCISTTCGNCWTALTAIGSKPPLYANPIWVCLKMCDLPQLMAIFKKTDDQWSSISGEKVDAVWFRVSDNFRNTFPHIFPTSSRHLVGSTGSHPHYQTFDLVRLVRATQR